MERKDCLDNLPAWYLRIRLNWNALLLSVSIFIIVAFYFWPNEINVIYYLSCFFILICAYKTANKVLHRSSFYVSQLRRFTKLNWRWFLLATFLLSFLIPARSTNAIRTIEIKSITQHENLNKTDQQIRIIGVFHGERCVLTPKQLNDQAKKIGRWQLRKGALIAKAGASLVWKGRLPYSLEHYLALRMGYGPKARAAQIVLDGEPQAAYLHFFKAGSNLNILFLKKKYIFNMLFDCMQRIIVAAAIIYTLIHFIVFAGYKINQISEAYKIDAQRINIYGTIFILALTLVACWPGDLKIDSLYSYLYARSNHLTDGRSLLYMLLWQMTFVMTYKPWPMLVLHLGLYWTGWWLLAETLRNRLGYLSFIPIIVAALPWMLCLSGTLLEQPLITGILLVSAVILLRTAQNQSFLLGRILFLLGLLYCAYSMRVLDGLAVIPLIYILVDMILTRHYKTNKIKYNIAGVVIVIFFYTFISINVQNVVKPEKVYKERTILSHFHALACNKPYTNNDNEYFNIYFGQVDVWRIGQPYYEEYIKLLKQSKLAAITHLVNTIKNRPLNFLKNYASCLKNTLRIGSVQSGIRNDRYPQRASINRYNLKKLNSVYNRALSLYVGQIGSSAVFRPWFILLSSTTIFICLKLTKRKHMVLKDDRKLLRIINLSALILLSSYIPLTIVPAYNYFLWASFANWFCITYFLIGAIVKVAEEVDENMSMPPVQILFPPRS